MTGKTTNTILVLMLIGIALGAALGFLIPGVMLSVSVIGELFVSALQLIVMPLIVTGIIAGVASLGRVRRLGRPLITALVYFVGTTALAVGIGLVLAMFILPGGGVSTAGAALPREMAALKSTGISDILLSFIPTSLPQAVIEGQYLGMIVFSLFFGGVLATLGARGRLVGDFVRGVREVILRLVYVILYAAPIGLLSVAGTIVAKNSGSLGELSGSLSYYLLTLGAGLLIHTIIVLPVILRFLGHRSPLGYFRNMTPALSTALATGSSAVAFPLTYTGVVDKNRVDSRAGALALPLGMTMNLNGTAMYVVIAALFIAQAFGMSLSALQIILIAVVSILVSLGAASIPHAGIFLLVFVLRAGGFPPEAYAGIGLIVAVDWLFDRFRAVVNVWGDAVGAAVVATALETEVPRERGATRAQPRKAVPTKKVMHVPAGSRESDREKVPPTPRPRRDRGRPPGAADQRDRTRTPTAGAARGPSRPQRRTEPATHDRPSRQRTERKREPRRVDSPGPASAMTREERAPSTPTETKPAVPSITPSEDVVPSREATKPVPPPAEAPAPEYGRRKARRGRVVKNGQPPASQDEPKTSNGQEEFPLDDISFGRRKKKRHR